MKLFHSFNFLTLGVLGDIYLHYPRGSNNRINEESNGRRNGNRLFDSQNNNHGGYNVAEKFSEKNRAESGQYKPQYFASGPGAPSELTLEWYDQHGCGGKSPDDPNWVDCQVVIQYSCQGASHQKMISEGFFPDNFESKIHESHFKNGHEADTPAYTALDRNKYETLAEKYQRKQKDFNRNHLKSGRHESWEYYDACFRRTRNNGLFVADRTRAQNLGATRTRQNENGQRRGFECPEERDFYPYWHPTPWTDIAVLTSQPHNCDFYKTESLLPKYECVEYYNKETRKIRKHFSKANHEKECTRIGGDWIGFYNFQEIIPNASSNSSCSDEARKIGKTFGSQVVWGVPYLDGEGRHLPPTERCLVLPPAVDCSSSPWSRANHLGNSQNGNMARYKWTLPHFHFDKTDQECILRVRYNISSDDYPEIFDSPQITTYHQNEHLDNDPTIKLRENLNLALATDTQQIGRTFQDRTHIFKISPRPDDVGNCKLHNLNVRGRRGNIVQTFPSVEYDFVPNELDISKDDCVHIQWEGSNTQPRNQAGEGRDQTDRNNMVAMGGPNWNLPNGDLPDEGLKTFFLGAEKFDYRIFRNQNFNFYEAKQQCERYNMQLPEPRTESENNQVREINKDRNGRWYGDVFLGIEGAFKFEDDENRIAFDHWRGRRPYVGQADHFVLMYSSGEWDDFNDQRRTNTALCVRPHVATTKRPQATDLFLNADWLWSSMGNTSTTEDLMVQMASSGYFQCSDADDCDHALNRPIKDEDEEESRPKLQKQLDNAPASFLGNIMKFNPGKYLYMSTRNNNFSNRAQKGSITVV